jgi:glycosyltransferase involved in cell wall biosynthesis
VLVYFVNHSSAPDHLGGAERSMMKLVEDWLATDPDFEPFFITKAPHGQFVVALEKRGWKFASFRYRGWAISLKHPRPAELAYFARDDYAAVSGIVKVMAKRRPDLVVTNTLVGPWGAFAAKSLGIPHAWFVREYGDLDHGLSFQHGRAETLSDIGLLSEAVFANSKAIGKHISQYIPASKVHVTYPALDVPDLPEKAAQKPAVTPFPRADPGLKITVVGRLAPSKGQWRVVDAVGKLKARGINASVCFVGAKMEVDHDLKLLRQARALGVEDRVVFAGEQPNPFPYAAAADVCITPSDHEAFGRTTLEYLTLGKPVLATRAGGSTELVQPGTNGYLFDGDDTATLADQLERYAGHPELIAEHSEAARSSAAITQSGEHGNLRAIEILKGVAASEQVYRLPNVARFWFDLPTLISKNPGNAITVSYLTSRLWTRGRNFVRNPVAAIRRRLRRP